MSESRKTAAILAADVVVYSPLAGADEDRPWRGCGCSAAISVIMAASSGALGGQDAAMSYASPQVDFDGLDQVNVLLPRSDGGHGQVEIALWSGQTAGRQSSDGQHP